MPRLFISRLLEAFFRRKWLYILALVPFIALGVVTVLGSKPAYRSVGSLQVNRTTVLAPTSNPFNGTPAAVTSLQIGTLLGTDAFLGEVRKEAEKTGSVPLTDAQMRSSISAGAVGDDLVTISATTADPDVSHRLAAATMSTFPQWLKDQLDAQAEKSGADVKLPQAEIEARYQTVDEATAGLEQPHRQKDAFTLVLFFALGVLVSAAALVVATLLDRSVRYGEEIETHLHVPVLASVPDSRAAIKPLVV